MPTRASQFTVNVFFLLLLVLGTPAICQALTPDEILVVANTRTNNSLALARYYMQRRGIPQSHLVRINATWEEHCSRQEYIQSILKPVRRALAERDPDHRIRCLVTMYGVPLAIEPELPPYNAPKLLKPKEKDSRAAVDSELALALVDEYPLDGWLPNPYFLGFQQQKTLLKKDKVLMVSRLDGPTPAIVRRIIDDAIAVEKKGLQGQAYFDARWPMPQDRNLSGYALYDASIHKAAEQISQGGRMTVHLDQQAALFQPGTSPQAALYCGWYSLGRYIDAFTWVRGAVGFHIASNECSTLKREGSQVWCKRMLERGITATVGPVYEPYVQAFPLPELFFSKLAEGYLNLGETYLVSLPFLSWQMVLIGDPLYQPFKPL
ncbi:TIGR03790 family protein [uncultured Vibrio sp.]|uniref:TIGR03790 family protein n=1 Tax=uncultured Vibrio sp. TaxID=114054 RepID=UPI002AA65AE2|nr:TIGR03790 family protein [uncultured Vibrio sp.]